MSDVCPKCGHDDLVPDIIGGLQAEVEKLTVRLQHENRVTERFDLCPDHRDKPTGSCPLCECERLRNELVAEQVGHDDLVEDVQRIGNERDELLAIVERLPKYLDTGKPFVPGLGPCWGIDDRCINDHDDTYHSEVHGCGDGRCMTGKWEWSYGPDGMFSIDRGPYSSREAAEAAKGKP